MRALIVLLAGPSGPGKTHLAAQSGLPVLELDDFYRSGDDPGLPRDPDLGIVDDMARDGRVGSRQFDVGTHSRFVGTGILAAEIVAACAERGVLADAVVVRRARWKKLPPPVAARPDRAPQAAPDTGTPWDRPVPR